MKFQITDRSIRQEGYPLLGQAGDSRAERVEFLLPASAEEDVWTDASFLLRWEAPSGRTGEQPLEKGREGESVTLIWRPEGNACAEAGVLRVQLMAIGPENLIWQSRPAGFTFAESIGGEPLPSPAEECAVITVRGRELRIPDSLRQTAAQGDKNSQPVRFRIPRYYQGRDLSRCTLRLKTLSSGGRDDLLLTEKEVTAREIFALWVLQPPQTSFPGPLALQLCAEKEDFCWQTGQSALQIFPALEGTPVIPAVPPIWEQQLTAMNTGLARVEEIAGRLDGDSAEAAAFAREQGAFAREAAAGLAADRAGLLPELTALTMAAVLAGTLAAPTGHIRVIKPGEPEAVLLLAGRRSGGTIWI